ncbi:MAG TPA: hypothetical protein VF789_23080 [Thermoanaerobaculia bacterium]
MKQKKEEKPRLLARTLAKELTQEDLKVIRGGDPPASTLAATLPSYKEDQ